MRSLAEFVSDTICTATSATVGTTVAVAAAGQADNRNPAAPINAVSHILWGDRAALKDGVSAKYTLSGFLLNAFAMLMWAAVFEALFGKKAKEGDAVSAIVGGTVVSALAYVTDYHIVPERFTPGFEKRLSDPSMFGVYAVLAVSLGLGAMCNRE